MLAAGQMRVGPGGEREWRGPAGMYRGSDFECEFRARRIRVQREGTRAGLESSCYAYQRAQELAESIAFIRHIPDFRCRNRTGIPNPPTVALSSKQPPFR
jgi:hypothetical protein